MKTLLELLTPGDGLSSIARLLGVEVALVTDNADPEKLGRVKVSFPRFPDAPESDWLRVVAPAAGRERGFYWLPEVNDEVLVAFERGESTRGYVLGALWSRPDPPPPDGPVEGNHVRQLRSRSGHLLTLDDTPGKERVTLADHAGQRRVVLDAAGGRLVVEALAGDLVLRAPEGRVVIECGELALSVRGAANVKSGGDARLEVAGEATCEAGPQLSLRAGRIDLN